MFRKAHWNSRSLYYLSQSVIIHKPIKYQSNTTVHVLSHRFPLHDLNVGVCCAVTVRDVTEPVFFEEILPIATLGELWYSCLQIYDLVDNHIWIPSIIICGEHRNNFVNNPRFLQQVKYNIWRETDSVWRRKLRSVSGNTSRRRDACLHHGSSHVETAVWNGPSWTAASEWDLNCRLCETSDVKAFVLRNMIGCTLRMWGYGICTRDVPSAKQESMKILDCSEDRGIWRLKNAGAYVAGHPTSFARNRKSLLIRIFLLRSLTLVMTVTFAWNHAPSELSLMHGCCCALSVLKPDGNSVIYNKNLGKGGGGGGGRTKVPHRTMLRRLRAVDVVTYITIHRIRLPYVCQQV
jgi:hypothetical protein